MVEAEGASPPEVDGHVFMPREGQPWGLCDVMVQEPGAPGGWRRCGLGQAAHAQPGVLYVSDAPRVVRA
jgi:hypothetical protein